VTAAVEALALKEGDEVEIHVAGERAFEVHRRPSARDARKTEEFLRAAACRLRFRSPRRQ
jgi:antitoxin MazE